MNIKERKLERIEENNLKIGKVEGNIKFILFAQISELLILMGRDIWLPGIIFQEILIIIYLFSIFIYKLFLVSYQVLSIFSLLDYYIPPPILFFLQFGLFLRRWHMKSNKIILKNINLPFDLIEMPLLVLRELVEKFTKNIHTYIWGKIIVVAYKL